MKQQIAILERGEKGMIKNCWVMVEVPRNIKDYQHPNEGSKTRFIEPKTQLNKEG